MSSPNSEQDIQQYLLVQQRIETLQNFTANLRNSMQAISAMLDLLNHVKPGDETEHIIPLQYGLHLKCKITEANPFILDTGHDILIEKDADFLKKHLDEQARVLNTSHSKMISELQQLREAAGRLEASYRAGLQASQ